MYPEELHTIPYTFSIRNYTDYLWALRVFSRFVLARRRDLFLPTLICQKQYMYGESKPEMSGVEGRLKPVIKL